MVYIAIDKFLTLLLLQLNCSFEDLTRSFEKSFFDDMKMLGVLEPSIVVRVSEHIPQILAFIERIRENNFAYLASNGALTCVHSMIFMSSHDVIMFSNV